MRQFGTDGRSKTSFERGVYNWQVRPAGGGGGNVQVRTATVACSGSGDGTTTPVIVRGTPAPFNRTIQVQGKYLYVTVTPSVITGNFAYSGGSTGYYSSGSFQMTLNMWNDASPIISFPCGNGGLIANPLYYVYSREGANDMLNYDGAGFNFSGSVNLVSLDMSLVRCSASASFKVLVAWTT